MVETRLKWFEYIERRLVESEVEDDKITRDDRGRSRKSIREIIKKKLDINELESNILYDRTLWVRM